MKKRAVKKLAIARETIANLKDQPVSGATDTFYMCSFICQTSGGGFCAFACEDSKTV